MQRPSHMSNGQLNDWLRCGKSYQLKRIQGAPSKPSVFLVAGPSPSVEMRVALPSKRAQGQPR